MFKSKNDRVFCLAIAEKVLNNIPLAVFER